MSEEKSNETVSDIENQIKSIESEIIQKEKSLHTENRSDESVLEHELHNEKKVEEVLLENKRRLEDRKQQIDIQLKYSQLEYDKNIKELEDVKNELGNIVKTGNDILFSGYDCKLFLL